MYSASFLRSSGEIKPLPDTMRRSVWQCHPRNSSFESIHRLRPWCLLNSLDVLRFSKTQQHRIVGGTAGSSKCALQRGNYTIAFAAI